MSKKLSKCVIVLGVIAVLPAIASKMTKTEIPGAKMSMALPEDWKEERDFLGVPLTLYGPYKDGSRPVIQVVDSGVELGLNSEGLKESEAAYQTARRDWVEGQFGQIEKFIPYQAEKWPAVGEVHSIGVRYRLMDVGYTERTYLLTCQKKLFYMKSLMKSDQESKYSATIDQTLRSFTCG